jgi:hypothetical protein
MPPRTYHYFVGIDPGKKGGLALLSSSGDIVDLIKMPETNRVLWGWIDTIPPETLVVLEKVHSMPKQGVRSMFTFGLGYGALLMGMEAAGLTYMEKVPRTWLKFLGIPGKKKEGETKTEWKNRLKGVAQRLYPEQRLTLSTCDALLIAYYGLKAHGPRPDPRSA